MQTKVKCTDFLRARIFMQVTTCYYVYSLAYQFNFWFTLNILRVKNIDDMTQHLYCCRFGTAWTRASLTLSDVASSSMCWGKCTDKKRFIFVKYDAVF